MRKELKYGDSSRPFRVSHQTLCITAFNFERQSLVGHVELIIQPYKQDLRRVKLNSKQCRIYRVTCTINNDQYDANFMYNDPTLEICQNSGKQRTLDHFELCHSNSMRAVEADMGNGEITIKLPPECQHTIAEKRPFRINIEFSLEEPRGGIKFVVPDIDGTMLDRGAHLFTYGHENASRLWFPCVDSFSEICTWKLEYSVDMYMTAISCGDLIETVYTPDLRKKTYHYYLSVPTSAPNIALAVGPFEVYVDPHMHEVTHFCLPHLLPVLRETTNKMHEAFEFFEELLSSRYPYSCYKQVFVDQAYSEAASYASMTILSTNLLYTKRIIEQVPATRRIMALAVARQFFGSFISMSHWYDAWLPKGIGEYLGGLYQRRAFGNNEYRLHIKELMADVIEYETKVGGIVLDPTHVRESPPNIYFPVTNPHTISSKYLEVYTKKAHLVLRMLEIRLGAELLLQVLNKILALGVTSVQQKWASGMWVNLLLSFTGFIKVISTVTGKDVQTFLEQWVQCPGVALFHASFVFNRKRNIVQLNLKQETNAKGASPYVGPLTVSLQELDGTFHHNFKIEENKTEFEITCHSKSRRNKKKKIPLCTGEEVEMDLSHSDADSPVLWLRIDHNMTLIRKVIVEQPDYMWQYMLRYERCIISQIEAIDSLRVFPTPVTRLALNEALENDRCFYRVRMKAAACLAEVANEMAAQWAGPPAMLNIFKNFFGSHGHKNIVKLNNFSNFQQYFMQKTLPVAMSKLRTPAGICPSEVVTFILDLFRYNDNRNNKYSDNYYRAALVDALAGTISPAVNVVTITGGVPSTDLLTKDTRDILEELTRYLNMEKLLPCYRFTVTVSCLRAIRRLQKFGHLPTEGSLFKSYACAGNFADIRVAALEALVDLVRYDVNESILHWLFDIVENDADCYIRHRLLRLMVENPPFVNNSESKLNTEELVEKLWKLMNCELSYDSRLRCDATDLYFTLYGRSRPTCLPIPESVMVLNLKDRSTKLNPSMTEDQGQPDDFLSDEEDMDVDVESKSPRGTGVDLSHIKSEPDKAESGVSFGAENVGGGVSGIQIEEREGTVHIASWGDTGGLLGTSIAEAESVWKNPVDDVITPKAEVDVDEFSATNRSYADEFSRFVGGPDTSVEASTTSVSMATKTEPPSMLSEESESSLHGTAASVTGPTSFTSGLFSGPTTTEQSSHDLKRKLKKKKNKKEKKKKKKLKLEKGEGPSILSMTSLVHTDHVSTSEASNVNSPAEDANLSENSSADESERK